MKIDIKGARFTKEDVEEGIKRLVTKKSRDIEGLQLKHLKCGQEYNNHRLANILNQTL
jgi:hypothetical protein